MIAGGMGDSGTDAYTFADNAENALANAARVSAIVDAVIDKSFRHQETAEVMC